MLWNVSIHRQLATSKPLKGAGLVDKRTIGMP
jgi:hypothetical protein